MQKLKLVPPRADVKVVNHVNIFVFVPLTRKGGTTLRSIVQAEEWQWTGGSLAVDHRYALDLAQGLIDEGLRVI